MTAPSNRDFQAIQDLINNKPEDNFGGLTFNEMNRLSFDPFGTDSPMKMKTHLSDDTLDRLPFFRLTEELLKIAQRDGYIKLTPLGALPKKTLTELYSHRLVLEPLIEDGIHKLTREIDSCSLTMLHHNTVLAGLLRKKFGRLHLTKEASKLLATPNRSKLFHKALHAYTSKLPWSQLDGYPELPVGNMGWAFTIFLLMHESEERKASYYGVKYIAAFPDLLEAFPQGRYGDAERNLVRCYCLRTFDRFLEWWGFVQRTQDGVRWSDVEGASYVPTPVLKDVFVVGG